MAGLSVEKKTDVMEIAERVQGLYGRPGLESWRRLARALRVPPATAHGLARGTHEPRPQMLAQLELLEWRYEQFPLAVAVLRGMMRREPVLPMVFSRARARRVRR